MALTEQQKERYSRHLRLPEIGKRGQERLLGASVLVVGAGGLGSAAALYLAAAGVGTIGIADGDVVELSNLQRQILHGTTDVGRPKTESAAARLRELNPDVQVVEHRQRLTWRTLPGILEAYEFVVDATDSVAARYLLNDACVLAGKGLCHGAVHAYEGQVMTIAPGRGPCYRCLYPEPLAPDSPPGSQRAGPLGAVAGVIGAIQAAETIKLILGVGEPLVGRMLVCDLLCGSFREVCIARDAECAVCGEHPAVTELIDYDEFCHRRKRR